MSENTKVIKKRISSVKNTKKITRSMQMIAAAKMQKVVKLATQNKLYTNLGQEILSEVAKTQEVDHALLKARPVKSELVVLLSSSRGLCGNFNVNVLTKAKSYLATVDTQVKIEVIAVGKKAAGFAKRNNLGLVALYDELSDKPSSTSIKPIARTVVTGFLSEKYDRVTIIYTDYRSSFLQVATEKTILPINPEILLNMGVRSENLDENISELEPENSNYKFEPSTKELLDYILIRLIENQIYQSVLESAASEHSSRMMAMKNATDSAGEIVKGLTLEYNKSRQAAITQEVAELIGGVEALSSKSN